MATSYIPIEPIHLVAKGTLASNGTIAIDNTEPTNLFLVTMGSWNISYLLLVSPNNGGAPVVQELLNRGGGTYYQITANGDWGITVKNTHTNSRPYSVYVIPRV